MTGMGILLLTVTTAVFFLWVFTSFGFLRALNAVKKQRMADGARESIGMTIDQFKHGFAAPEFRQQRNKVMIITLGLFALLLIGRFGLLSPQ